MNWLSRAGLHLGLRPRLFLAMLVVAITVTAGFAVTTRAFVEILEDELVDQTLERELDSVALDYRHHVPIAGSRGKNGFVYVLAPHASLQNLPPPLRRLAPGEHREVHLNGQDYYVARRDLPAATLYYMLNGKPISDLEHRLAMVSGLTLIAVTILTLFITILFSVVILRPVRALAQRLADIDPADPGKPVGPDYRDRDIRQIAASFDAVTQRFHAFVERERAFTEDAGHELRTPLAVALTATELLQLDAADLPATAIKRIERTRAACLRMERLVAALLFLARREQRIEHCDAASVLDEVLEYYVDVAAAKGIRLSVHSEPSSVSAPAGIIDCVLHNLIENAVEHTAAGQITIRVTSACIEVHDTGEGISERALAHIFDRRYRSESSRGFGIGLYLVQLICQRLGWQIHVDSHAERGTRFRIDLLPMAETI